jgi:hypothetical protein
MIDSKITRSLAATQLFVGWRPVRMSGTLSLDFHERVVAAV